MLSLIKKEIVYGNCYKEGDYFIIYLSGMRMPEGGIYLFMLTLYTKN